MGDDWRNIPDITHLLWVKIAFLGCPTSRWLAASLFMRPAGGDSGVAAWRLPTCGRVPRGSPADARLCTETSLTHRSLLGFLPSRGGSECRNLGRGSAVLSRSESSSSRPLAPLGAVHFGRLVLTQLAHLLTLLRWGTNTIPSRIFLRMNLEGCAPSRARGAVRA